MSEDQKIYSLDEVVKPLETAVDQLTELYDTLFKELHKNQNNTKDSPGVTSAKKNITKKYKSIEDHLNTRYKNNKANPLDKRAEDAFIAQQQLEKISRPWLPEDLKIPKSPYEERKEDMALSTYALIKSGIAKNPDFSKNTNNIVFLAKSVAEKITTPGELDEGKENRSNAEMIYKEAILLVKKFAKKEEKGFGKVHDVVDFLEGLKLKIKKAIGFAKENKHISATLSSVGDIMKRQQKKVSSVTPLPHAQGKGSEVRGR
ncbi:MAG: hypothetical protein V4485_00295 [Pseudomonadota bacterium]